MLHQGCQKVLLALALSSLLVCSLRAANALSLFGGGAERPDAAATVGSSAAAATPSNIEAQDQLNKQIQGQSSVQQPIQPGQYLQQAQNQPMDFTNAQQYIEFGLNPLGTTAKLLFPNTYNGFANDLTNGYSMMANNAQKGYSQLNTLVPSAADMFGAGNLFRNRLTDMLQQRIMESEAMIRQLTEMVSNPEQMCREFVQRSKQGLDQGAQVMTKQQQSLGSSASSMLSKFGGGGFSFG